MVISDVMPQYLSEVYSVCLSAPWIPNLDMRENIETQGAIYRFSQPNSPSRRRSSFIPKNQHIKVTPFKPSPSFAILHTQWCKFMSKNLNFARRAGANSRRRRNKKARDFTDFLTQKSTPPSMWRAQKSNKSGWN